MAASMWSTCRFSARSVLPCGRGTSVYEKDLIHSGIMRSCLLCRGISNVSRKMRFLATSSVTRHLLTSMKDERETCYGFTRLSAAVTSRTALFNRAFTNLSTSWCRTICSSCVVFSEHNLNSSPKIANSNNNNATKLKCNSHNGLGQARQGGLERPVQETMRAKKEKKENIKTIPNMLTALRMASAPLLGYLVIYESFWWALSIFVCAGVTDLLDGFIARNFANQTSALGSVMDPLADKFLVSILTVSLTCVGLIPLPLTLLIVSRDLALIVGGFYIRYRSLHPPITLSRYFDISHATAKVNPTFVSKVNTGLQLTLVASSLAAPVFGFVDHALLQALWYTTGTTTFASGIDYMWSWKKYVTLLEKDQTEL